MMKETILAGIAILFIGWFSKHVWNIFQENKDLRAENSSLKKDIDSLRTRNAALEKENTHLKEKVIGPQERERAEKITTFVEEMKHRRPPVV